MIFWSIWQAHQQLRHFPGLNDVPTVPTYDTFIKACDPA